ncbi:MAG: amidohydrolase [Pseudomonadales bacterium]
MKSSVIQLVICITFLSTLLQGYASAGDEDENADIDLILSRGQVKTPSGWEESIAITDGIIVAVGGNKRIEAMAGARTVMVNLDGDTVLPGLHDSHVHPLFAGLEQFQCGFKSGASPEVIAGAVRLCAKTKQPGEWLLGGNWVAAVFEPGQQNREFLDAITSKVPVLLNDEAHHSVWVNSLALELAGITLDTPDPEGGIIERDALGQATGLLRESAVGLVTKMIPRPSMESRRNALMLSTHQMLSYGITSFTVASVRLQDIGPLSSLSREGLVKQRIRGCIVWVPSPQDVKQMAESLIAKRAAYTTDRFSPDCIKLFLDGVPTESHTASMLEPYIDEDNNHAKHASDKGFLLIAQDELNLAVSRFDRLGLHVKFHAAGDGAVRAAIEAVSRARALNGSGGPFHHVGHSTFVNPADIIRAKEVNLAWEFSPYIWYPTPIASIDIFAAVGAERMERWVPIRDAVASGALVVAGSDWSVVPSVNPWLAIETMVTRQKPGGSKQTLGEGQSISLTEAFDIMTVNGARLMGHRDKVGSIEVGMHADIIVTRQNPFRIPITDVHATTVKMTFIDGEKVFDIADSD